MHKKIISVVIVLSFLIIPFFTYAAADPMTAYGYQITIVKYSGPGSNPTPVGKPILVYHPDLFADITIHRKVDTPSSYGDLMKPGWGLNQIINPDTDMSDVPINGDENGNSSDVNGLFNNPYIGGHDQQAVDDKGNPVISKNEHYYTKDENSANGQNPIEVCGDTNRNPYSGKMGYANYILKYQSKDRRITYHTSDITNLGIYYATYSDSNLTGYNIKNDNYLDSIIKNKYFKDVQSVKKYFGINIDYKDIDKYYVSVEPVQRVLDGIKGLTGSYLINTIEVLVKESDWWNGTTGSKGGWKANGQCDCRETTTSSTGSTVYNSYATCKENCNGAGKTCGATGERQYKCTTTTTIKTCYKVSFKLPAQSVGKKNFHQIYGKYADGYSHIQTSRSLGSSDTYLNRAVNYCDNGDNKHCELEDDNITCKKDKNGNIIYRYYIGPNPEKALVDQNGKAPFLLNGTCTNGVSGNRETGIKHYYLLNLISCENSCSAAKNKYGIKSDEYLKCAENYCDAAIDFDLKGNQRIRKKDCIMSCGYVYGKTPDGVTNGDKDNPNKYNESKDSCSNASPYKGMSNIYINTTSQCSIDKNGNNLSQNNSLITSCAGDRVTDFDGDDTNDEPFDQRKYINIACKESSGVQFVDLSRMKIVAGQGIDYWGKVIGERECTAYFNLEQWKFDYATISSKDPDRRKRLLYIYNVYNNALNDNYSKEKDPNYDKDFADQHDGEVNWNEHKYNTGKINMVSQVREIVNNAVKNSDKYNLIIKNEENSTNATIIPKNENGILTQENVTQIFNMNLVNKPINRYLQTSKVEAYYIFDKYCVSIDGKATVYKAPANGICYQRDDQNILGKNVYYTDLNATRDKDFTDKIKNDGGHSLSTDVSIGTEIKDNNPYYEDKESCPYKIDSENLQCSIVIKNQEGTIMHGNDIYVYGNIDAILKTNEKLGIGDEIKEVGLSKGNTPEVNGLRTLEVGISDRKNGVESIDLIGVVRTEKNVEVTCTKKVYIINPDPKCGVSCSVERVGDNKLLYEIKSPEPGNKTQNQKPKRYETALSTNMSWKIVWPDIYTNKYLVRLDRELGNKEGENNTTIYDERIVYGKVQGTMLDTGATCYNVCWSEPPELPNCPNEYSPSDMESINSHCELYWDKDINNYENYSDCVNKCSGARMCPDDRRNMNEVEKVCQNNYKEYGFKNASNCVNYCYYCPECSSDYLYRPVNNYNPFPYSSDSNTLGFNYQTGERIIPSNWIGKTQYIKKDNGDKTSVTSENSAERNNPEYVIELTPEIIRQIRSDTNNYNGAAGNDAYLDYVYMSNVDTTKKYYSKFINETFRDYFTIINGEKIK